MDRPLSIIKGAAELKIYSDGSAIYQASLFDPEIKGTLMELAEKGFIKKENILVYEKKAEKFFQELEKEKSTPAPLKNDNIRNEAPTHTPLKVKEVQAENADSDFIRPELDADCKDLSEIVPLAWHAQSQANKPERLFKYGSTLARITNGCSDAQIEIINKNILRWESSQAIDWQSQQGKRREPAYPPYAVVESMMSMPLNQIPLPDLEGVTPCPVFSEHGNLEDRNGYLSETRRFHTGEPINELPKKITAKDIKKAVELILIPFEDFQFESEADRDNAIALMITPFIKPMLGNTACIPGGLITAPVHGSGKGLLAKIVFYPGYGRKYKLTPLAEKEEEIKKSITALMCEGCPAVMFDNINAAVDSASLAALFTTRTWSDRILGLSKFATIPNDIFVLLTGNNVILSGELSRRFIRARLLPQTDRPWLRDGFHIENLSEWIEENRIKLQQAIITIVKGWIGAGRPIPENHKPFGSFESWSKVMSGIMHFAGFKNFLGNALEFFDEADREGNAWRTLCSDWYEKFQSQPIKAADLFDLAKDIEGLPFYSKTEDGNRRSFGKQLLKQKDRVFDNFQIKQDGEQKGRPLWKVVHVVHEGHVSHTLKFSGEIFSDSKNVPNVPHVPNWDELSEI